jgi:hypothetical protein
VQNQNRQPFLIGRASITAAMLVAAILGIVAFIPSVDNQFVYDDLPAIVENPLVTQPGPWYRFWREPYWPRGVSIDKLYRPLTTWSFRANVVLSGKDRPDARSFHLANLALHALTGAGVALLAWRVTGRAWAAWLAGILFAVHPLHTEAVVTGYGRSELLAALFGVWLMARYVRPGQVDSGFRVEASAEGRGTRDEGREKGAEGPREGTAPAEGESGAAAGSASGHRSLRTAWFHVINAVLLLLAVMSKEHSLLVWPGLMLYDGWRYRRMRGADGEVRRQWFNERIAPAHLGFILATTVFFLLRFSVFGEHYRMNPTSMRVWENPVGHATLIEHLLTPFRLLWLTLEIIVWPRRLCPIWSIPAVSLPNGPAPDVVAGMLLLALLVTLSVVMWRRGSALGALLGGLLILLAIPVHALPMANWLYAERWLYLPSTLMAVLVAAALARVPVAGWALGLAAAGVLLPASWQYGPKFANNLIMNQEVIERQPDNFQGRRNLALAYYQQNAYREAIAAAREVVERFGPVVGDPYWVLIQSHLALGEGREAMEAINTYEWIRRDLPGTSLSRERERAEALLTAEASESRPAERP